jgi:transposase
MRGEIISEVERRRRWPAELKLRILSEALEPDASISAVADRHGVSRSLLYSWLRLAREDRLPGLELRKPSPSFVPVRVEAERAVLADPPSRSSRERRRPVSIEITLANGRLVRVDESVDPLLLARIVAALDGGAA